MKLPRTLLLPLLALAALVLPSRAVVLDWTTVTWADGATSGNINNDAGNPGNDVSISIVATGVSLTAGFPKNAADDGVSVVGSNDATTLHVRTPTFNDHVSTITITITFNYAAGVNNVSFNLIDVDATTAGTGWTDGFKSISATNMANTAIAMTATSANTSVTSVSGSGTLGMTVTGLTSAGNITDHSGDVTLASGATAIKSLTFTWYSPVGGELGGQVIAFGNISYTNAVPEIGSSLGALALCGGLLVFGRRRRLAGLSAA